MDKSINIDNHENSCTIVDININDVLRSPAQRIVFNCLMQGMKLKDAAKKAKLAYSGVRSWSTKNNIKALVKREQDKIGQETAKKLEITKESQIQRFRSLSRGAEANGQFGAATSAEREISTICGLYAEDNAQRRDNLALFLINMRAG